MKIYVVDIIVSLSNYYKTSIHTLLYIEYITSLYINYEKMVYRV